MAVAQRMSEQEYEAFVGSGVDGQWELHDGRLVEKPGMSWRHLDIAFELGHLLRNQLDRAEYRVFVEGRVRRPTATIFIPDVLVVPTAYGAHLVDDPRLAIFSDPLPFVAEVWSPSTGDYDVETKIPIYRQRGDREIWRIHPYERTLTRWVRQPDERYVASSHRSGIIALAALPGVIIDLDRLFTP
ncbi:MAG: Uma2 family endonuclease [Thermomicrobiales bacterium]